MYALGLVLWETARRVWSREPREYRAPFAELVPSDPSFDEMRKIVCVDGARPKPPPDPHPVSTLFTSPSTLPILIIRVSDHFSLLYKKEKERALLLSRSP